MNFQSLRGRLAGELVAAQDPGYETRRGEMVWNRLAPAERPAAIVRVASTGDVVQSVRYAREHGLRVTVRGGGHHWSGVSLREGALLLDLSRLSDIAIDPAARRASVQPVVSSRDFARRLEVHGLAFPYGHCPGVALSGYLLGGGFGWNQGMWGPGCANVEAVEVVTANGEVVVADATNEPELLWAARGAGPGFFGVVTRFHLKLHPLPDAIRNRVLAYSLERLAEIAAWLEALAPRLAPCVEVVTCVAAAPPDLAERCRGSNGMACFIIITAFAGSEAEASAAVAAFLDGSIPPGCLLQTPVAATDFEGLFDDVDRLFPAAHRYLADTFWSKVPAAQALSVLSDAYATAPSRQSLALAVIGLPPGEFDALTLPGGLLMICYGVWAEAAADHENREWYARLVARLEPLATAHYVGEADLNNAAHTAGSYTAATWTRLQSLRRRYDPDGLFCGFPDNDAANSNKWQK